MAALKGPVKGKREKILEQLDYWRQIRLDVPARKAEAIRRIDELLDELGGYDGTTAG